ncbi:sulfotransferase [Nocardioides sp. cx-169]|uniref:sulfotransferase n=1 Tax=Nocardioides sp. cx-169 TaxID=2899080 RepID=UPI001E5F7A02|nr:sulfotransferase [Nocardioides sp. cx-169]MCD4535727.1 sulfotransferase [Nocardioides sp. cx-169]
MKTFLLGPGCQKGGTTWLYQHLKASTQFAHGYRKEYHVFDVRDLPSESWTRERVIGLAEESLAALRQGEPAAADVLHRMSMVANPRFYFDYFAGLLAQRPEARATGDFTPDYALLPAERLRTIRRGFERRGVRAAAIFLMRDPVDRTWSQIRMRASRRPESFTMPVESVLREQHGDPTYALRSQYGDTVRALDEAFGDDVHYELYERLFTAEAVGRVCRFAGMEPHEADFDRVHNASGPRSGPPEDVACQVALHYAPVYRAVAERFPDLDLREWWPSARYVLD